ncbi:hypothetical protein K501DRAFT_215712 [Backusella circina FSU 941]|nr:hypothetical protein K501DRAFT_215712 [Backusella circina FSU 941]
MENDLNKKRKLSDPNDPTDFLNFDYGFPINPSQDPAIPDDFFLFVTDQANAGNAQRMLNSSNNITIPTAETSKSGPVLAAPTLPQQYNLTDTNFEPPNQAVFTIAVGGRVFRLSWESLKSDGPTNFFLEYFRKKKTKVMYVDRDPDIFEVIVRHLRGYYVRPIDDIQAQSLLFDATYYGLTRLKKCLQEYLYINVGGRIFRLPWDLFRKDGTHNFFTGPLMHSFLSPHGTDGTPPIYIDRDPDIFADIINHLRGYTIHIRDEMHRKNLLKDAQYYVFRQLSDKLLTAQQSVAGFGEGMNREVLLLLQDIRVVNMLESKATQTNTVNSKPLKDMTSADWSFTQIQYKRAADGPPHALLVQIADISMQIHRNQDGFKLTFEMNESDMKKMRNMAHTAKASNGVNHEMYLDGHCAMTIDDTQVKSLKTYLDLRDDENNTWEVCQKCKDNCSVSRIILQRAICGVHLVDNMITLCALRLEAISSQFRLNLKRQFLPG